MDSADWIEVRPNHRPGKLLGWIDLRRAGIDRRRVVPGYSIRVSAALMCRVPTKPVQITETSLYSVTLKAMMFTPAAGAEPYIALNSGELSAVDAEALKNSKYFISAYPENQ